MKIGRLKTVLIFLYSFCLVIIEFIYLTLRIIDWYPRTEQISDVVIYGLSLLVSGVIFSILNRKIKRRIIVVILFILIAVAKSYTYFGLIRKVLYDPFVKLLTIPVDILMTIICTLLGYFLTEGIKFLIHKIRIKKS